MHNGADGSKRDFTTSMEGVPINSTVQSKDSVRSEGSRPIRVFVVDCHPIVRLGLRTLLEKQQDMQIVGEADGGREALESIRDLQPDVVLLDLNSPTQDNQPLLQQLRQVHYGGRIIIFTASEDKNEWVKAMKMGCSGIVVKQTHTELIVKSIRKVHEGEIWLDSHTTAAVMRQFSSPREAAAAGMPPEQRERSPLSNREREIVALVAQGYKNKEMAEKMFISEQTVKNHLHNIFDKLGVSDRLELALYAIHKGLHLPLEK